MSDVLGPESFYGLLLFGGSVLLTMLFAIVALVGLVRQRASWIVPGFILAVLNLFVACLSWDILNRPMGNLEMDGWNVDIFATPIRIFGVEEFDWADGLLIPWVVVCFAVFWLLRRTLKSAA